MRFSELLIKFINTYLLTLALFLKIAAAPLHIWMPSIVEGLSWQSFFILITAQKISPLLVLSLNFNTKIIELIFFIFIVSRAIVGSIRGLTQSSLKKILTFSSIRHLRWILTALIINKRLWVRYFFIYSLISLAIITTLKKNNTTKIAMLFKNKESNKSIILNFLSLGGLPPFTGFLPKLSVILSISIKSFSFLILPLILGSLVRLFFYLRIAISTIFFSIRKPNNQVNHKPLNIDISFFINMTGLLGGLIIFLELLDFKLKKL